MEAKELCKILIVDDEVLIRQGIKHYMNWEQEGFQIIGEALNGREALAIIERTRPHIVLTDIVMPVMDGEELTREIKKNYPEIEVVVLSSFSEFDYVRAMFQSGAADYILKPKLEAQGILSVLQKTAHKIPSLQYGTVRSEAFFPIEQTIEKLLSGWYYPLQGDTQKNRHVIMEV